MKEGSGMVVFYAVLIQKRILNVQVTLVYFT